MDKKLSKRSIQRATSDIYLRASTSNLVRRRSGDRLLRADRPEVIGDNKNFDWASNSERSTSNLLPSTKLSEKSSDKRLRRARSSDDVCLGTEQPEENENRNNLDWADCSERSTSNLLPPRIPKRTRSNDKQMRRARSGDLLVLGTDQPEEKEERKNFDWGASSGGSRRASLLQTTPSERSIDSLPKGVLSPLGKRVLFGRRNSLGRIKVDLESYLPCEEQPADEPDAFDFKPLSISMEETKVSSPTSSVATVAGPATDVRAAILSRIPPRIKDQLTLDEWNVILEPARQIQNEAAPSESSDILRGLADILASTRQTPKVPSQMSDKVYDALYCTENQSKPRLKNSNRRDPLIGESKVESRKSSVSFAMVLQVRRYQRILEVHPCTSSGPSLGIGWEYIESTESTADWNQSGGTENIRLNRETRERMVKELGYTARDVAYAVREGLKIKNQRRKTINNLKSSIVDIEKVEYIAEKCNRTMRNLQQKFVLAGAF